MMSPFLHINTKLCKDLIPSTEYSSTFINAVSLSGFFVLLLITILIPMHHVISETVSIYYREILSSFIALLALILKLNSAHNKLTISKVSLYVVAGAMFVFLIALGDPKEKIYGYSDIAEVSTNLESVNESLYVLRNFVLYIPMFAFLSLVQLSRKQLYVLMGVIGIMGPISIGVFLAYYNIIGDNNLILLLGLREKLFYNTFVPYLTFPAIAITYLLFEARSIVVRLILMALLMILTIYIAITTSRQSLLFILLIVSVFLYNNRKSNNTSKYIIALIFIPTAIFIIYKLISLPDASEILVSRFSSLEEASNTGRIDIMLDGLSRISCLQWLTGAGLTTVISSGPHNDYIRWLQRIGILGMFVVFLPYFYAFKHSLKKFVHHRTNLHALIFVAISYTLYHSFFGYPREDAYQSIYCWLGLGIFASYQFQNPSSSYRKVLKNLHIEEQMTVSRSEMKIWNSERERDL